MRAESRDGHPAAAYDVRVPEGVVAHVNVWSDGARIAEDRSTVVDVALAVRNRQAKAILVDMESVELQAFDRDGAPLGPAALAGVHSYTGTAQAFVAPESARDFELRFVMSRPIDPDAIGSFRLRWAIIHGGGRRYVQFTDFRQEDELVPTERTSSYVPVYGYYDPYYWDPVYTGRPVPVGRVIIVPRPSGSRSPRNFSR